MKFFKIVLISTIVCVFALIALVIALDYVSPSRSVDYLKERLPEAILFFETHEENLAIIRGIEGRRDNFSFSITRDEIARLTEYYDGVMGKVASRSALSISESGFLSEEEKNAILEILSSREAQEFSSIEIVVSQDYTQITLDRYPLNTRPHAVMLITTPSMYRPNTAGLPLFYPEQLSDMWHIEIFFRRRA